MTPREIVAVLNGIAALNRSRHEEARARNYELANLTAFAFHAPKKMPKYKPIGRAAPGQETEVATEQVRGYLIGLAMQGKNRPKKAGKE